MADTPLQPGAHLAAVLGARGARLDADEARRLLECLLRLYDLGSLVFEESEGCTLTNRQPSKYADAGEG